MNRRISRRAFVRDLAILIGSLGLSAKGFPQQLASPRRIGALFVAFSPESMEVQEFRQGLREAGYVEGRDVVIEWGFDYNRISELVDELIRSKVEVIVVTSTLPAQALKRATSTIPIVMAVIADPLGSGLVTNLAHPGGNITGLSMMMADLTAKRLQLLKETIPMLTRVAVLWNPDTPYHTKVIRDLKAVAPSLSIELSFVSARAPRQFGLAFSAVRRTHAQALYVIEDPVFYNSRMTLVTLASQARLPIIYWVKEFAESGGLMSYGANYSDLMRRSVWYVDKILKGAKPADLPIEQPTKLEFVVNLRVAKALGITIPQSILLRADEVIK